MAQFCKSETATMFFLKKPFLVVIVIVIEQLNNLGQTQKNFK